MTVPLTEFDAEMNDVYLIIGKIVAGWGAIDFALDALASIIHRQAPAAELPRSLRQKTRFLRRAVETVEMLRPFAVEGTQALDRINALKQKRHRIVHGIVLRTTRYAEGYRLAYSEFQGQSRLTCERPLVMAELEDTAAATRKLGMDISVLHLRILDGALIERMRRKQAQ